MSSTPVCRDNSISSPDRRHHVRRRVSALAYLDIGTDNGGIALNLSEGGMAFQAVGPLDSQTNASLRIQLPDSRTRIKIAAQFVWIRESNRQAGVRFVDLPSEGRAQIQEWIRSQISPNAPSPSEGILESQEVVSEPSKQKGALREPRKDKWLNMMAKFKEQESAALTSQQIAGALGKGVDEPIRQETAKTFPASGSVLRSTGVRAIQQEEAIRLREVLPQGAPCKPRTEPAQSDPDGHPKVKISDFAAITVPSHDRADFEGVLESTIPFTRTVLPTVPKLSTLPILPADPPASEVESDIDPVLIVASTIPALPAAAAKSSTRKWATVAVSFALLSILSFSIGTWVGSLGTRIDSMQIATPLAVAVPVTEQSTLGGRSPKANRLASTFANKALAKRAGGKSDVEVLKGRLEASTSSPFVLPVKRNFQSPPTKQSPTPLTAANQPESPFQLAPVPDDSAAKVAAPRIVGGRTLRPTDRFNPCHLTYRVEPAYPPEAQQQGIEGIVKIHLVIGTDGTVRSLKLLSGPPLLAPAAMDAANHWQYLPALLNGQPIETDQDIEIDFQLPH